MIFCQYLKSRASNNNTYISYNIKTNLSSRKRIHRADGFSVFLSETDCFCYVKGALKEKEEYKYSVIYTKNRWFIKDEI